MPYKDPAAQAAAVRRYYLRQKSSPEWLAKEAVDKRRRRNQRNKARQRKEERGTALAHRQMKVMAIEYGLIAPSVRRSTQPSYWGSAQPVLTYGREQRCLQQHPEPAQDVADQHKRRAALTAPRPVE